MENKNEAVIANYIEKMMGERRQKIFESDEYIQQDNGDLDYLEERYSSLKIPYVIRRVVDDYIACLESRDERYADIWQMPDTQMALIWKSPFRAHTASTSTARTASRLTCPRSASTSP